MLSFTKFSGWFSQRASRSTSLRQRGKTQPRLEAMEGRVLMCNGPCHNHAAEIAHVGQASTSLV